MEKQIRRTRTIDGFKVRARMTTPELPPFVARAVKKYAASGKYIEFWYDDDGGLPEITGVLHGEKTCHVWQREHRYWTGADREFPYRD